MRQDLYHHLQSCHGSSPVTSNKEAERFSGLRTLCDMKDGRLYDLKLIDSRQLRYSTQPRSAKCRTCKQQLTNSFCLVVFPLAWLRIYAHKRGILSGLGFRVYCLVCFSFSLESNDSCCLNRAPAKPFNVTTCALSPKPMIYFPREV